MFYGSLVLGFGCQLLFDVHVLNLPYVLLLIVLPLVVIFFREPLGKLMAGGKGLEARKMGRVHHPELFRGIRNPAVLCIQHHVLPAVAAFVLVHAGMMMAVFAIAELFARWASPSR